MAQFVSVADYERHARDNLPRDVVKLINSGEEITVQENIDAFKRIQLRPRMLRDVSQRSMITTLLGETIDMPIGIAPTGLHVLTCPDGEVSTAKAGQAMNTCYVMALMATSSVEEVAQASPSGLRWQQLLIINDRNLMVDIIRQVERQGFKALVITIDAPATGSHKSELMKPLEKFRLPLLAVDNGPSKCIREVRDTSATWKDLKWLKSITNLPIVVKGVLTPEDAILAVEHGVSAVWVSNHGGRQLNTVSAPIDALPDIVSAVGDRVEVYVDCGIRTGTDVFKALALGARAVFVGRPVMWGLACKGQEGAEGVLGVLKAELDTTMALTGCAKLADITSSMIIQGNHGKIRVSKL